MRLTRKDLRPITVRTRKRATFDTEDVYTWEDGGTTIMAGWQPMAMTRGTQTELLAEKAGQRYDNVRVLYYAGILALTPGMGLCVDVPPDASCDYRIIAPLPWSSHQQVVCAWIPEAERA